MTSEAIARGLVLAVEIYLVAGWLFAVPFVLYGAGRIDPRARGGSVGFRLLILPGTAALWPLLALRWLRGASPPEERNAHRCAARAAERLCQSGPPRGAQSEAPSEVKSPR
jgi:hypothetical protein